MSICDLPQELIEIVIDFSDIQTLCDMLYVSTDIQNIVRHYMQRENTKIFMYDSKCVAYIRHNKRYIFNAALCAWKSVKELRIVDYDNNAVIKRIIIGDDSEIFTGLSKISTYPVNHVQFKDRKEYNTAFCNERVRRRDAEYIHTGEYIIYHAFNDACIVDANSDHGFTGSMRYTNKSILDTSYIIWVYMKYGHIQITNSGQADSFLVCKKLRVF